MFWTIAWCASQIFISSASVDTTQCFDSQYQVYDSSTALVQFYATMNPNQKASAKMFEMKEVQILESRQLEYVPTPILPVISEQN